MKLTPLWTRALFHIREILFIRQREYVLLCMGDAESWISLMGPEEAREAGKRQPVSAPELWKSHLLTTLAQLRMQGKVPHVVTPQSFHVQSFLDPAASPQGLPHTHFISTPNTLSSNLWVTNPLTHPQRSKRRRPLWAHADHLLFLFLSGFPTGCKLPPISKVLAL